MQCFTALDDTSRNFFVFTALDDKNSDDDLGDELLQLPEGIQSDKKKQPPTAVSKKKKANTYAAAH